MLYRKLPHQHHPTPHLKHLPGMVAVTYQPAIHSRCGILTIPALSGVGGFKLPLAPGVVNDHAKLAKAVVISNGAESVVKAVAVGGEGVGDVEGKPGVNQRNFLKIGAAFGGLHQHAVIALFGYVDKVSGIAGIPLVAGVAWGGLELGLLFVVNGVGGGGEVGLRRCHHPG